MTNPGRKQWRLLSFLSHDAATNMAIDEAILEAHLLGIVPATLRLYNFDPSAISIGHTQQIAEDIEQRAVERGLDIVRRSTGGRAVLHCGDLTYSFVGSSEDGTLSSSVTTAYKQICCGLQNAFERLGVRLELGSAHAPYRQLHDCFLATTGSDLHVGGRKMIGSAQLRRRGAVLQHGSILLNQDQKLMPEILGASPAEDTGANRHANLFDITGRAYNFAELEAVLKAGFESAFAADLHLSSLTEWEQDLCKQLRPRYAGKVDNQSEPGATDCQEEAAGTSSSCAVGG